MMDNGLFMKCLNILQEIFPKSVCVLIVDVSTCDVLIRHGNELSNESEVLHDCMALWSTIYAFGSALNETEYKEFTIYADQYSLTLFDLLHDRVLLIFSTLSNTTSGIPLRSAAEQEKLSNLCAEVKQLF